MPDNFFFIERKTYDLRVGKVWNISIVRVQTIESSIINGAIRQNVLRNKFRIPGEIIVSIEEEISRYSS